MSSIDTLITIVGLAFISLLTRGFFVLPQRELPLPGWLKEGLRYAPVGALVALIAPELVMRHGALIGNWRDAQLFGAAAGIAWFLWRRGMLGTIVAGTATMLALRVGLGW